MIATLPALTPMAASAPATRDAPADEAAFAALLDEKQLTLPDAVLPDLARAAPAEPEVVETAATRDDADKRDAEADADAALLALLNLTPPTMLPASAGEHAPPQADNSDDDARPADKPAGPLPLPLTAALDADAGPVATEASPESAPQALTAALPAADRSGAVVAPEASARPARQARLVTDAQPAAQPADDAPARATARTASPPELTSSALPAKESRAPHGDSAEAIALVPHAPPLTTSPADRVPPREQALETGTLSETMGTPAWQQSLGQQIACFTRNGVQHAELRLHPAELGSLQINVQLKNEQAQLHFVSASHQVRAAIEAAVPHLRTSLAEAGIQLGQSSVGADTASSWQQPDGSAHSPRHAVAAQEAQESLTQIEERSDSVARPLTDGRGINTFA
jgi:flagellar hook-length control protein FliK